MTRLFLDYLGGEARRAEALYILGDLFDAWVGDDARHEPYHAQIIAALKSANDSGLAIYALHGNRDFLLGSAFADASGVQLLVEPYLLSTATWRFVLAHGDALCTNDADYMTFRHQVRTQEWQSAFLAKPLAERLAMAAHLREQSEQVKQEKSADEMDLNRQDTDDFLRQHGYATFIHGHTHQPAQHDHIVDGIHVERWVLADWHADQGEYLAWDGETLQRVSLR